MASDISSKKLVNELEKAVKEAKSLLKVLSDTEKVTKDVAEEMKDAFKGVDKKTSKGIVEFNKLLKETNQLIGDSEKLNQQKIKTEQELIKAETLLIKAIDAEEKANQTKLKTNKAVQQSEQELIKTEKALIQTLETEEKLNQTKIKTKQILRNQEIKEAKEKDRLIAQQKKLTNELSKVNKSQIAAAKNALDQKNAYKILTTNTNEAQAELKKLNAEFGVGSKETKEAKKQFEKFDAQLREVNEDAKDGRRDVGRYKEEVGKLADEMKNAANKAGGFGDIISTVTSPVGLATAAASGLAASFLGTAEGGNKAKDVMSQLTGGFNAVTASVGGFVGSLLDGESVTEAYTDNLEGLTDKVEEQSKANLEATQLSRKNRIELRTTSEELAKLRGEYELLSQQSGDATTTLEAQNDATIKQAEKAAEITNQELVVLDKQIEAINLQIEARKGLNNQDLLDERQEFINQQIELDGQLTAELAAIGQERNQIQQDQWEQRLDFLFDASDRQKSITESQLQDDAIATDKRLQLFAELSKGIKETYAEIESEFEAASGQQINIAKFANLEAKEQARLISTFNLSEIGRNRLKEAVVEYLQVVQDLEETQADLNDVELKSLSLQNEIAIQRRKLGGEKIELEKEFTELRKKELQEQLDTLEANSIERLEAEKELNSLLLKEQEAAKKAQDKQDKKDADDELKKEEEKLEARQKLIEDGATVIEDILSRARDKQNRELDTEIDALDSRIDTVRDAINSGNSEASQSLAELEKQKIEAEKKKEQLRKKEIRDAKIIAGLQLLAANSSEPNAVGKTLGDVSLLLAALSQLPSFFEGTEDTGTVKNPLDSNGGRTALLHDNERVMTAKQNSRVGSLSNDDLADLGAMHNAGTLNGGATVLSHNNKELVKEVKEMTKAVKSIPIQNYNYDSKGKYHEQVIKSMNKREVVKVRVNNIYK